MVDRDHILAEIRRLAAENSGKPPGEHRLLALAGIKTSDWRGRFWVRYSDAIKEAGFEPNSMNAPRPEEEVLADAAKLVSELGHFPVWGELAIASRSRPGFPSMSVFRRLGGMGVLASRLTEWFEAQGDSDRAGVCRAAADRLTKKSERPSHVEREPELGFVYLIKSGRFFKVGRTNAVGRRERELAIQLPERASVVHSIKTDDPIGIESYWHRRFGERRRNGEWFELTPQDISAFRRRKFM